MTAGALVIGLDAAEATLLEKWSAEGLLPNIARLTSQGSVRSLGNSLQTLPGAIWPEITSGQSGGKIGHFCTVNQIPAGESRYRPVIEDDVDSTSNYWSIASRAGLRVAAIDQVQCGIDPHLNGIEIIEWGCHDRNFRTASQPPALLDEVNAKYGPYPVQSCDSYPKNHQGYIQLLEDLLDGVRRKTSLLLDLLGREEWDLFTCSFGESHCAGHQLWRFHDLDSEYHDASAPTILKDALASVYAEIDKGIGELIDANGDAGTVLVFASHGMGRYIGGYQLIPEILSRLGMSSDAGKAGDSRIRQLQDWMKKYVPMGFVPFFESKLSRLKLLQHLQGWYGGMIFPLDSPKTRAVFVPNNRVGAIRLNIKGREPNGCLEPGVEVAKVVDELKRELMALRHVGSGEPIVERVLTADEVFGRDHHPGIPDVMVVFSTDLGRIDSCRSERVGVIRQDIHNVRMTRTGDHTPESRLWMLGQNVPTGARLADASVLDLAPEILGLLGVPVPQEMDGKRLDTA